MLKVFSIDGRLLKEQTISSIDKIDLSMHAKGIYFVQITQENGKKATKKVVIQ